MRKIYQSAPDVPQAIANKAIDIIERQMVASGVRRVEELPEEGKVHMMRELQWFFQSELVKMQTADGETTYSWEMQHGGGTLNAIRRWLNRFFQPTDNNLPPRL